MRGKAEELGSKLEHEQSLCKTVKDDLAAAKKKADTVPEFERKLAAAKDICNEKLESSHQEIS